MCARQMPYGGPADDHGPCRLTICHAASKRSQPADTPHDSMVSGTSMAAPGLQQQEDHFRSPSGNPVAPGPRRLLISKAVIDFNTRKIICYRSFRCPGGRHPILRGLVADRGWGGPFGARSGRAGRRRRLLLEGTAVFMRHGTLIENTSKLKIKFKSL